jgi:hypothetical protein
VVRARLSEEARIFASLSSAPSLAAEAYFVALTGGPSLHHAEDQDFMNPFAQELASTVSTGVSPRRPSIARRTSSSAGRTAHLALDNAPTPSRSVRRRRLRARVAQQPAPVGAGYGAPVRTPVPGEPAIAHQSTARSHARRCQNCGRDLDDAHSVHESLRAHMDQVGNPGRQVVGPRRVAIAIRVLLTLRVHG